MEEHHAVTVKTGDQYPSLTPKCFNCAHVLRGAQRKFCSTFCKEKFRSRRIEITCNKCGKKFFKMPDRRKKKKPLICRSCIAKKVMSSINQEGENNPSWRGGFKLWQKGKMGRDKNGLSWKHQRLLAWERDNYSCCLCGKHKEGWKPDVHHINTYRFSYSHRLSNLKCLCRSCHKKVEARIKRLWGGKIFGGGYVQRDQYRGLS
jgi:5-methylcytosine-specific restriction endonuclease McrA